MYTNKYPFIFVHGMMGWGECEAMYKMPYWGMVCGNLVQQMRDSGVEAYAPQVGPLGSAWDRACELYAQLVGGTVDYGEAHSKAHGHARYGRTFDKPLFEGWGQPMADGGIKKIHLIGHSFGGATIRTLASLLDAGSEEERKATKGDDLSPLFAGGHGDWVMTVTGLSAPHDGTTFVHAFPKLMIGVKAVATAALTILANLGGIGIYDVHMEQFGLNKVPGDPTFKRSFLLTKDQIKGMIKVFRYKDNVYDNLRIDEAAKINKKLYPIPQAYYFSIAGNGTKADPEHPEFQIRDKIMIFAFIPFAKIMGRFPLGNIGGYEINENWRPNDGLVPLESARFPQKEPHEFYEDAKEIKKGIWYTMPDYSADHGTVIGGSLTYIGPGKSKPYKDYWKAHCDMLQSLED